MSPNEGILWKQLDGDISIGWKQGRFFLIRSVLAKAVKSGPGLGAKNPGAA